ncbi:hypothetical protein [Stenotrophomonas sp.]|uniref:DUF6708 domain-containing protein n=1 Tax=Stenotrophomonas sp. TaxID=69392 RepID=UPI0028985346|nr:hypothetical protein [Stenotrophomonas sp.]
MYLIEMIFWKAKLGGGDSDREGAQSGASIDDGAGIRQRINREPGDESAVFAVNKRFMDVQGAWQEDRRGVVTFVFLGLMYVLQGQFLLGMIVPGAEKMISGIGYLGRPLAPENYVTTPIIMLMWAAANIVFFRFCWRWVRLELFVQRRIIVRFNRVTRQVHINRPACAGGTVTLPWDATVMEMTGGEPGSRTGDGTLIMGWSGERTGVGFDEICMLGGLLDDQGSAEALGEYIRRYMEEGPDAVPQPKRLRATFPWPWDSVRSTLSFLLPSWRNGDKGLVLTLALLLSPLLLLHSLCHWISLLLCWPTWWPRIIRRAGLPGAPVPALTVAEDYGPEIAQKLRASVMKLVKPSAAADSVSDA